MQKTMARQVYEMMTAAVLPEYQLPGVDSAFTPGSFCMQRYTQMLNAYARLCERLGVIDEDEDVECIISSLLDIQEALCCQMFLYGAQFEHSYKENGSSHW